ncbi:hypothetical protein XENOCAPTIV_012446, partial [Xenoophorus captivus]
FTSPAKMATTGRSALLSSTSSGPKSTLESSNPEEEDGQNLWSTILSEVSTHSRSKLPSGKNVLVMGGYLSAVSWLANGHREVGSGKTTLVAKLQGIEEYMKGRGLEYLYFSVHDDDIDGLQGVAVPVGSIEDTLLLITVDMSRPWNALDSLQKWAAVAREHIDKLRVAPEKLRELEHKSESNGRQSGGMLGEQYLLEHVFFFFLSFIFRTFQNVIHVSTVGLTFFMVCSCKTVPGVHRAGQRGGRHATEEE